MFRKLLDSPRTYFVAAILLLLVAISTQFEIRLPARDVGTAEDITKLRNRDDLNVVFILIDTLRADRLSAYGYDRPTSPTLKRMADQGVLFKRVLSQSSWTKTSMASIWTGTEPINHGITRFNHAVPEEAVFPAELFKKMGKRTTGIWRNGWVAPNFGFGQGFDTYLRPRPGRESARIQRKNPGVSKILGTDEDLLKAASDFLEIYGREPFFLYLHMMDLHQYLYDEESAIFGNSYTDVYDQAINWTDRVIRAFLDKLETLDLTDKTVIIVASDHGEAFQEHGTEGHAKNLFREVTQVPFIISFPFRLDQGIVIEDPVRNVDIWPTILDLLGMESLPNIDGESKLPLIMAAAEGRSVAPAPDPGTVFAYLDRRWGNPTFDADPILAVKKGDLRFYIRPSQGPKSIRLFDHSTDPTEATNIAGLRPEDVVPLQKLAQDYLTSGKSPWGDAGPIEVELDALKLEQLRALGYVIK